MCTLHLLVRPGMPGSSLSAGADHAGDCPHRRHSGPSAEGSCAGCEGAMAPRNPRVSAGDSSRASVHGHVVGMGQLVFLDGFDEEARDAAAL